MIFALAHDFRIMRSDYGRLCLNEINIGSALPPAYDKICKETMDKQANRMMTLGAAITPQEGLKLNIVSSLYTGEED